MSDEGPETKRSPRPPDWRRARVVGRDAVVDGAELIAAPGTCAGCRRPFNKHSDEQLYACAALYAPTQDNEGGP